MGDTGVREDELTLHESGGETARSSKSASNTSGSGSENESNPAAKAKKNSELTLKLYNIHMSLTNVLQYVSFSSPLLLVFFITLYSIVQNNYLSGLIFNMGIVIISSIVYLLKHILKNKQQKQT